jgi:hypothetical protein
LPSVSRAIAEAAISPAFVRGTVADPGDGPQLGACAVKFSRSPATTISSPNVVDMSPGVMSPTSAACSTRAGFANSQ